MNNQLIWKRWISPVIWIFCLGGVAYYFLAFLYITFSRINYPFALEWMEGTSLVQVERILSGKLLYVKPSLEYVPLIYPPLYYYISAALMALLGFGFLPLRLVSLISTLCSIFLIYQIVRMRAKSVLPAILSAGFFAATFSLSGGWFDIARVDMLSLFFMLLAIFLASFDVALPLFFSGIFFTLACITKQTFFIVEVTFCVYLLLFRKRKSLITVSSAVMTYSLTFALFNLLYHGWYKFFVYEIPAAHVFFQGDVSLVKSFGIFFMNFILKVIPIIFSFSMIYLFHAFQNFKCQAFSDALFLPTLAGATGLLSWIGLANPGGYLNVLLPAYAMLAIIAGLGLDQLLGQVKRDYIVGFLGALCILQFVLLYYPISSQIPTQADLDAGMVLVDEIKSQPGDVYIPFHPELSLLAGKTTFASWIALLELSGGFGGEVKDDWYLVSKQLVNAYKKNRFTMIILDVDHFFGHPEDHYTSSRFQYVGENTFYPVTGSEFRPIIKYFKANQ